MKTILRLHKAIVSLQAWRRSIHNLKDILQMWDSLETVTSAGPDRVNVCCGAAVRQLKSHAAGTASCNYCNYYSTQYTKTSVQGVV